METALLHSRRRIPDGLPDLNGLECCDKPSTDKAGVIAALLRQIAAKTRNDHLQPFYSMRLVAEHFHVAPAMVSRIYHRLSAEGLLRTVWGSKTLLEPVKSARNGESWRIGVPVSLSRFTTSAEYRESILLLQVEMWNHEIDEHLLFFKDHDDEIVDLCTRNHHPRIDTLVWLFPSALCRQTVLRLHDLGFRVFCITDRPVRGIPDCYLISRRSPTRTIIRKHILRIQ
jgi:DNA-binding transcriptional regulator YhcF (GntR family)